MSVEYTPLSKMQTHLTPWLTGEFILLQYTLCTLALTDIPDVEYAPLSAMQSKIESDTTLFTSPDAMTDCSNDPLAVIWVKDLEDMLSNNLSG